MIELCEYAVGLTSVIEMAVKMKVPLLGLRYGHSELRFNARHFVQVSCNIARISQQPACQKRGVC